MAASIASDREGLALRDTREKSSSDKEGFSKILKDRYQQMASLYKEVLERGETHTQYPVDLTIANYQKLKAEDAHVYSSPLYTHAGGYHFKLVFWLNGVLTKRGTHMSVWVVSIEDDYEDIHYDTLLFPISFTVRVTLLSQTKDHLTRDIECQMPREAAIIGYNDAFISHGSLESNPNRKTQYLKDDTITLRIEMAGINHK